MDLKQLVYDKQKELELIIEERLGICILPSVEIDFSLTSIRHLGLCYSKPSFNYDSTSFTHVISLNATLLEEFKETYIDEVFVHEYAHAIVNQYFTSKSSTRVMPHGKEFKKVCSWFGIIGKPKTSSFHSSSLISNHKKKKATWNYHCSCMVHSLSTIKHNKILKGSSSYSCKKCKSSLVFENELDKKKPLSLEDSSLIQDLELIIDLNRVGSDEIYYIEEAISFLNNKDYIKASESILEILSFSDRLSSNEHSIFEEVNSSLIKKIA